MLASRPRGGADDLTVIDRGQIEIAVVVEIHRLVVVVVCIRGQRARIFLEPTGAVVDEQAAARAALARHQHVEVPVVVVVSELDVPGKAHEGFGHTGVGAVLESPVAQIEPQSRTPPDIVHVVAGSPVGEHDVEIAVGVHIPNLEIANRRRTLRKMCGCDFRVFTTSRTQEEATLGFIGRSDEYVGEAVAGDITHLDDPRDVGRRSEDALGGLLKGLLRPPIQEDPIRLRVPRFRIHPTIGE